MDAIEVPGDYYLNPVGDDGDTAPSLWFRLPVGSVPLPERLTDQEAAHIRRFWNGLHRIDGTWRIVNEGATVHVEPSILTSTNCGPGRYEVSWHGFLEHGIWRTVQ